MVFPSGTAMIPKITIAISNSMSVKPVSSRRSLNILMHKAFG